MDKVIYRKYPDGEVIALFPQIAVSTTGHSCQSYLHIGQHGGASPYLVVRMTVLATPKEYAGLHTELKRKGYKLKPAKRLTRKDFKIREGQYDN